MHTRSSGRRAEPTEVSGEVAGEGRGCVWEVLGKRKRQLVQSE